MKTLSSISLSVVVGLLLVFSLTQATHAQENYSYVPCYIQSGATPAGERFFQTALNEYKHGNSATAFVQFKLAVRHSPSQSQYWLYMGVAYLLENQSDLAIPALEKADRLSANSAKSRARWYLAQSYLMSNRTEEAIPLLQWVSDQHREYAANADTLLMDLSAIARK